MVSTIDTDRLALIESVAGLAVAYVSSTDAPGLSEFIRILYSSADLDDLRSHRVEDLAGAARGLWKLGAHRLGAVPIVRVHNPSSNSEGWNCKHTVVEVISDDMPFIVDSILAELERHGLGLELALHPIVEVRRDAAGILLGVATTPSDTATVESFLHLEIERCPDPTRLALLESDLLRVLEDVKRSTGDWVKILAAVSRVVAEISASATIIDPTEANETRCLLEWMADHHFTFLGYQEFVFPNNGLAAILEPVADSALGLCRDPTAASVISAFSELPEYLRERAREPILLDVSKGETKSTVHRRSYFDCVTVKKFDAAGKVRGEHRFIGLWTSAAYHSNPIDIPVLRNKVSYVVSRAGLPRNSHSSKDLIAILEAYPRDELFQTTEAELYDTALGILGLHGRRRVCVFARVDRFERFASVIVYVPRDLYNTAIRLRIDAILREAFAATDSEFTARVTESSLARLHFILRCVPGHVPSVDVDDLELSIAAATRTWADDLTEHLISQHGDIFGSALSRKYAGAFPAGYQDSNLATTAAADIACLETMFESLNPILRLDAANTSDPHVFTIFHSQRLDLSDVMPRLTNMHVRVLDERPYQVKLSDGKVAIIERFGIMPSLMTTHLDQDARRKFEEAFAAQLRGDCENDSYNGLVLAAGLTWREVVVFRAYGHYLRQIGTHFSQEYLASTLIEHPEVTRGLAELFTTRFDPSNNDSGDRISADIQVEIDKVASLDHDRILRRFLNLINATVRTNYFQTCSLGKAPYHFSFKLASAAVAELPRPVPVFEIFVYSPRVEGIHLRMGMVARGGIRWSDRKEDFRTEVLGLVKAQTVKNAVIVPVGSKGGFVVKDKPASGELPDDGLACYQVFVNGMLDLTDNLANGRVVPPQRTVRYDPDDTYLVVAADKGTAKFSDVANAIATERQFWLGDAFASGGSDGYDHKQMGITARGVWESVRQHLAILGIDADADPFSVVGIGDMSGDVFGNGMLLSTSMQLVAAFDHRHIFLDPTPDVNASFIERERLFGLATSSWDDYDRTKISTGGGVFARTAKSIEITPEMRNVLGIVLDAVVLTPAELISAIIRAPVTLLYNGGIGTYVKASDESHEQVGDKANDAVRVDGRDLRCQVVAEGGNLGLTQLGRIEFALGGGRVNTDAIDNSGGVDCSDHEVNIKILLASAAASGALDSAQRNDLLVSMTRDVTNSVLADNQAQNRALAIESFQSLAVADVHLRLMHALEKRGDINRRLEYLPTDEAWRARRANGKAMTAPEISVLLAYAKNTLSQEVLVTDLPDDVEMIHDLLAYFPDVLRTRFEAEILSHPLRREILTTVLVNNMVNRAGVTFAFRLQEETGASAAEIVRAHLSSWRIFDQDRVWEAIGSCGSNLSGNAKVGMFLESAKLTERGARWLLRNRHFPGSVAKTVAFFREAIASGARCLPSFLRDTEHDWIVSHSSALIAQGVSADLARLIAELDSRYMLLDISDLAVSHFRSVEQVAALHCAIGARLGIDWLRDRVIEDLRRDDLWHSLARDALRDDAYAVHREITDAVLAATQPSISADAALDEWIEARSVAARRTATVIEEVRSRGVFEISSLSVAIRALRELI